MINKTGNNLALNAIFQYFWRQFLEDGTKPFKYGSVSSQI